MFLYNITIKEIFISFWTHKKDIYFKCVSLIFIHTQHKTNSLSVANLPMRTTSSLECFHSKLNRTVAKKPNFFKLTERLKMHESRSADRMHNTIHDILPDERFEPKLKRDKERAAKIKHFTDLLCNEKITVGQFLNAMAAEDCKFITYQVVRMLDPIYFF